MGRLLPMILAALFVSPGPSWAWMREAYSWTSLIGDSELIVVGRLTAIPRRIGHQHPPGRQRGWHYEGRLAIDRVLKGNWRTPELPVVIGMPLALSHCYEDGGLVRTPGAKDGSGLVVWTEYSSTSVTNPDVADAKAPAIWLLARRSVTGGRAGGADERLAVCYPEHIRPLSFLPFLRAVLRDGETDEIISLLGSEDVEVRRQVLRYVTETGDRRAFPAVTKLLGGPTGHHAVRACVRCGGEAAIPYLRPLLSDETSNRFHWAADALGRLGDAESLPRLLQVYETASEPRTRESAGRALACIGDLRAMPSFIAALKQDIITMSNGTRPRLPAQEAIEALTGCRLSPNGDKAQRWWRAAEDLPREAWRHFAVAELIDSIPSVDPMRQDRIDGHLRDEFAARSVPKHLNHMRPDQYDPQKGHDAWDTWLKWQEWIDHESLPSQIDDELSLRVRPVPGFGSGEPVRLLYTVTNASEREVWLTKRCYEMVYCRYPRRSYTSGTGTALGPALGREGGEFFRLPSGESRTVMGRRIVCNDPRWPGRQPPDAVAGALVFPHKGAEAGLDAWTGEVWSTQIALNR